jgi:hypothetical protein
LARWWFSISWHSCKGIGGQSSAVFINILAGQGRNDCIKSKHHNLQPYQHSAHQASGSHVCIQPSTLLWHLLAGRQQVGSGGQASSAICRSKGKASCMQHALENSLKYGSLVTVNLLVSFSSDSVPGPDIGCLGLEHWVVAGSHLVAGVLRSVVLYLHLRPPPRHLPIVKGCPS